MVNSFVKWFAVFFLEIQQSNLAYGRTKKSHLMSLWRILENERYYLRLRIYKDLIWLVCQSETIDRNCLIYFLIPKQEQKWPHLLLTSKEEKTIRFLFRYVYSVFSFCSVCYFKLMEKTKDDSANVNFKEKNISV